MPLTCDTLVSLPMAIAVSEALSQQGFETDRSQITIPEYVLSNMWSAGDKSDSGLVSHD